MPIDVADRGPTEPRENRQLVAVEAPVGILLDHRDQPQEDDRRRNPFGKQIDIIFGAWDIWRDCVSIVCARPVYALYGLPPVERLSFG